MCELSEMIRDYIHECFNNENRIPHSDEIYERFQTCCPSDHIIEKEVNFFFEGNYVLSTTKIEWEGRVNPQVQIELEDEVVS
jgi:hypothetical protein